MPLIISKAISRREFGADAVPEQFVEVLRRSTTIDLSTMIKGSGLPPASKLLKVYATRLIRIHTAGESHHPVKFLFVSFLLALPRN